MKVVLDTETTGLTRLSFANRTNYHHWPRMVQLAWAKIDDDRIRERLTALVRPEGFAIPPEATRIHGIDHDTATDRGIPVREALKQLQNVFDTCDTVIAHNLNFDLGVIQSEAIRAKLKIEPPAKRLCTLHLGQRYLAQRNRNRRGGRLSLDQLYETLFGFPFAGKHNAEHDVTACFHIYKKLKQLGTS